MDEINLVYFNNTENKLEALAFYSGIHNCSKGENFDIKDQDIIEIANNSNQWLEKRDLPIFTEHNKFSTNIQGVIKEPESFIARPIDENDVERNPKLKNLIGNMGLFLKNIELTNNVLLENIKKGVGKAVSVGVDLKNKVVHELSLVGLSALPQASIFNKDNTNITYFNSNSTTKNNKFKMNKQNKVSKFALTMDEALQESQLDEQKKEKAKNLLCVLLDVIEDIKETSDEELQGKSKEDIYNQAMNDYMTKLDELVNPMQDMLQVNNPNNQQVLQQNPPVQPNSNPRMNTSYSSNTELNEFGVPFAIDTFDEMENYLSEYGLLNTAGKFVAKKFGQVGGIAGTGLNAAKGAGSSGLNAIKNTARNTLKSGIENTVAKNGLGKKILSKTANVVQNKVRQAANLAGNNGKFGIGKSLNAVNRNIDMNRKKIGFKSSKKLTNFKNKGKLLNY